MFKFRSNVIAIIMPTHSTSCTLASSTIVGPGQCPTERPGRSQTLSAEAVHPRCLSLHLSGGLAPDSLSRGAVVCLKSDACCQCQLILLQKSIAAPATSFAAYDDHERRVAPGRFDENRPPQLRQDSGGERATAG
jgi:hypothetical protein